MEEEFFRLQAATHIACLRMTDTHRSALRDSADRASCLAARRGRKAAAYAEIFDAGHGGHQAEDEQQPGRLRRVDAVADGDTGTPGGTHARGQAGVAERAAGVRQQCLRGLGRMPDSAPPD
ncbi:MAG TPA: hypothetical protein VGH27_32425 [Streptosporangiaceae bacterium]|jgi:hypothetical protein